MGEHITIFEGELKKKGDKRWFVLHEDCIVWYKSDKKLLKDLNGVVPLEAIASVSDVVDEKKTATFSLAIRAGSAFQTLALSTDHNIAVDWVKIIKEVLFVMPGKCDLKLDGKFWKDTDLMLKLRPKFNKARLDPHLLAQFAQYASRPTAPSDAHPPSAPPPPDLGSPAAAAAAAAAVRARVASTTSADDHSRGRTATIKPDLTSEISSAVLRKHTDWLRVKDETSGAVYFVNVKTKESVWQQPPDWTEELEKELRKQLEHPKHGQQPSATNELQQKLAQQAKKEPTAPPAAAQPVLSPSAMYGFALALPFPELLARLEYVLRTQTTSPPPPGFGPALALVQAMLAAIVCYLAEEAEEILHNRATGKVARALVYLLAFRKASTLHEAMADAAHARPLIISAFGYAHALANAIAAWAGPFARRRKIGAQIRKHMDAILVFIVNKTTGENHAAVKAALKATQKEVAAQTKLVSERVKERRVMAIPLRKEAHHSRLVAVFDFFRRPPLVGSAQSGVKAMRDTEAKLHLAAFTLTDKNWNNMINQETTRDKRAREFFVSSSRERANMLLGAAAGLDNRWAEAPPPYVMADANGGAPGQDMAESTPFAVADMKALPGWPASYAEVEQSVVAMHLSPSAAAVSSLM